MADLLAAIDALPALRVAILCGGIATFCGALLCRACPECGWFEWACARGDEAGRDAAQD